MKLLVLEDNMTLSNVMKKGLEKEGYQVDCFDDGESALDAINNGYSCFILDINVPSLDGISLLKHIRSYNKDTTVLIISSNHELDKIKSSYEFGCNDYIKKPFFIYELVQKVKHLCIVPSKFIQFSPLCKYSFVEHILYENDEKIILTKKEILFLELYIVNLNKVVSYEELETYVWEGEITNLDNIRALVKRLRKKLPEGSIKIVTGLGYTLGNTVKLS
ncbi:MAG: DNA-binding response regulator [Arcobacter sp.]|nr:MAG: DNA-binding response regulator [Arcobacter sp.]